MVHLPVPLPLPRSVTPGRGGPRRPLALCYGTRPQVVKASVLGTALGARWPLLTIDTGQHYDYELNALHYEQLGVRPPHRFLEIGAGSQTEQIGAIVRRAGEAFEAERPWAAVVVGDTNSTLGCAIAAAKLRIPVVHVEAGLRARDALMSEEITRRMVDVVSHVLCAPSAAAAEQLRAERVTGAVVFTGDVARDVLLRELPHAPPAHALPAWPAAPGAPFVFATLHRAELVDDPVRLAGVLRALGALGRPVVLPLHPRTRATLERHALTATLAPSLHLRVPLGYRETIACVRDAACVVTDSGGVQREAYWLGTPCVTVRAETEWPETVERGANVLLSPALPADVLAVSLHALADGARGSGGWDRDAYGAGDAATKVGDAIERTLTD